MQTVVSAFVILLLLCGGTLLGMLVRTRLPDSHLTEASQSVVKLGIGILATMSALVLGLLLATAKGSYDTKRAQINQITADVILLDQLLAEYGGETDSMRQNLRRSVDLFVARFWQEREARFAASRASLIPNVEAEKIYHDLRLLVPGNEFNIISGTALSPASKASLSSRCFFPPIIGLDPAAFPGGAGALAHRHLLQLRPPGASQSDNHRHSVPLRAVDVSRDLSDLGYERSFRRADGGAE